LSIDGIALLKYAYHQSMAIRSPSHLLESSELRHLLGRMHVCDLLDFPEPPLAFRSFQTTTHAVLFPHMVTTRLRRLYASAKHCQEKT